MEAQLIHKQLLSGGNQFFEEVLQESPEERSPAVPGDVAFRGSRVLLAYRLGVTMSCRRYNFGLQLTSCGTKLYIDCFGFVEKWYSTQNGNFPVFNMLILG